MNASKYIKTILPDSWEIHTLYVYMNLSSNEILSTYGNPTNIIQYMWKNNISYATDPGTTYNNTGAFLIEQCINQNYPTCNYFLKSIIDKSKLNNNDLRKLSFLFLHDHAIFHPSLLFGHINKNQKYMLVNALKLTNVAYPNYTADSIISNTGYGNVRSLRPI